jgi:hypothetical protein
LYQGYAGAKRGKIELVNDGRDPAAIYVRGVEKDK